VGLHLGDGHAVRAQRASIEDAAKRARVDAVLLGDGGELLVIVGELVAQLQPILQFFA
jgi:hypothetical protein